MDADQRAQRYESAAPTRERASGAPLKHDARTAEQATRLCGVYAEVREARDAAQRAAPVMLRADAADVPI